jgi:hypothetical protein
MVLGSLSGVSIAASAPAEAYSYGWVYLVFPTWLGNCPAGGSVYSIEAAVGPYDDVWSGGDSGDDIIYPEVALGQTNEVDAAVLCKNGSRSYWNDAVHATFKPTRTKQTFWVGPAGTTHN